MRVVKPNGSELVPVWSQGHEAYVKAKEFNIASARTSEKILSKNGFVGTGTVDDSAALQASIDEITASKKRCGLVMPDDGLIARIDSGIVFDASTAGYYDLRSLTVDASDMVTGIAWRVSADKDNTVAPENLSYGNSLCNIFNFKLKGPGYGSLVKGLQFHQPNGSGTQKPGPARSGVRDFYIRDFSVGAEHFSHSYGEVLKHGEISNCGNGVIYRNNPGDSGERTTYDDVMVFNNTRGLVIGEGATAGGNVATWFKFRGGSIDYNQVQVLAANGAKVELVGTHIEGDAAASYYPGTTPFIASGDGTVIRSIGGELVYPEAVSRTIDYFVDNTVPAGSGGVYFDGADVYRIYTNTGYFAKGSGETILNGLTSVSTNDLPLLISAAQNEALDGGFENSTVPDLVQITADTAAITSRLSGTNLTIVSSAAISPYHSGSRALRVNKVGGGGTSARWVYLVQVRDQHKRGSFRVFLRKTVAGTVTIQPIYASLLPGASAGVTAIALQTSAEGAISFTDTSGSWIEVKSNSLTRKTPLQAGHKGASHYGLLINQDAMAAHNFDVDDIDIQFI